MNRGDLKDAELSRQEKMFLPNTERNEIRTYREAVIDINPGLKPWA